MKFSARKVLGLGVSYLAVLATVVLFQNCGESFNTASDKTTSASGGGTGGGVTGSSALALDFGFYNAASVSKAANQIEQFEAYNVAFSAAAVSGATYSYDLVDNAASCVLGAASVALNRTLTCSLMGSATVRLIGVSKDGSISMKTSAITVIANQSGTSGDPLRVDFHIPAGTAAKAYNTLATAVVVFVGQTLRIYNDDTTAHRLHTGGTPFAHMANNIPIGGSTDVPVTAAHTNAAANDVYDHDTSSSAYFYIKSLDGSALYATNCASCHGAVASSTKRRATAVDIRQALNTVSRMSGITLTDDEVRAIAFTLR